MIVVILIGLKDSGNVKTRNEIRHNTFFAGNMDYSIFSDSLNPFSTAFRFASERYC